MRGPTVRAAWQAGLRRAALALGGVLCYALPAVSQQLGRIEGEVADASSNRPMGSAQLMIGGTQLGAISGANGRFAIANVPAGTYDIQVRLIGFRTQSRRVTVQSGETAVVNFRVSQAPVELDEVVVTGTAGMGTRRDVGNSIATVQLRDVEQAPVSDISQVLNGTTAGLQQFRNEGQVGGGSRILLRGIKSVSQSPEPLIYVDGIRMNNNQGIYGNRQGRNVGPVGAQTTLNPLDDLNPDDVERVEIVRGAAATTLYGTEAAGGVIQVFTKRGRSGQAASWSVRLTGGTNYMTGNNFGNVLGKTANWGFLKPHMKKGPLGSLDASVSGGTPALAWFFSGVYDTEEGVVRKNDAKRYAMRGNFGFEPAPGLRIDLNTGYTRRDVSFVESGDNSRGLVLNVLRGTQDYVSTVGGDSIIYDIDNIAQNDHFVGGVTLTHTPSTSLVNRFTLGLDLQGASNWEDIPFNWPNYKQGSRDLNTWTHRTLTADYAGTWSHNLTKSLTSRTSFGGQAFADWDHLVFAYGEDFGGPGKKTVSSAALRRADEQYLKVVNAGFFLQQMLGLNDRLFVTGGLRVDGNSAFGTALGLQVYPKVSASYILSEHPFWPGWWQVMKLRAAYGESGKAPGAFDAVRTWTPVSAYGGQPGVDPSNLGNPDLGPERSKEIELGFESGLLDDRIGIDFTWYRSQTTQALFGVTEPPSQGFLRPQLRNVGKMQNKGFELTVKGTPIATDFLRWDMVGTVSTVNSKVIDLGGAPPFYLGWGAALGQWIREGYPTVALFGQKVTNPDEIADPIILQDQFYGPVYPTKTFGLSTTFNIARRFTLNARGDYAGGQYQLNIMPWQQMRRGLWPECTQNYDADPANAKAIWRARCSKPVKLFDLWIRPADFFKVRTVSLGIELPRRWIPGTTGSSFTIAGSNLWKWTKSPGLDPELTSGDSNFGPFPARYEYYQLPAASRVSVTLRLNF